MSKLYEAMAEIKLTTENIQKVIKMFPRDNDWKNLITKHRRDIDALRRGKDLPKKVEDELFNWALDNNEIKTDDVEELEDFIDRIMNEEAASVDPKVAKAVEALNRLGYMLRGRRRFHAGVKRVETFFRSGNKKLLQGAIDVLDPDIRDDVMGILEPLGFVKNGVVESDDLDEGFSPKDIKMAIGVASDKRYAGGNMSGAVKAIEKIKKGLSDHPQVSAVLKRQNEEQ